MIQIVIDIFQVHKTHTLSPSQQQTTLLLLMYQEWNKRMIKNTTTLTIPTVEASRLHLGENPA